MDRPFPWLQILKHTSISVGSIFFLADIDHACVYFLITLCFVHFMGEKAKGETANVVLNPVCAT